MGICFAEEPLVQRSLLFGDPLSFGLHVQYDFSLERGPLVDMIVGFFPAKHHGKADQRGQKAGHSRTRKNCPNKMDCGCVCWRVPLFIRS